MHFDPSAGPPHNAVVSKDQLRDRQSTGNSELKILPDDSGRKPTADEEGWTAGQVSPGSIGKDPA